MRCIFLIIFLCFYGFLNAQYDPNDDFDGDTIINSVDLDDDNDGISDLVESIDCETGSLNYEFYDLKPSGNTVDNIPTTGALSTGNVTDFDVNLLQSIITPSDENTFSIRYTGSIVIYRSGTYTFFTRSDDGSKLFINGTEVVNNDGVHPAINRSGSVELNSGIYDITILYFENGADSVLEVFYVDPSLSLLDLSFSLLSSANCNIDFDLDTDGDTIPNRFDVDSDNDGCFDAIEAGHNSSFNNNTGMLTEAVGNNGLANTLETDDSTTASTNYNILFSSNNIKEFLDVNSFCLCSPSTTSIAESN